MAFPENRRPTRSERARVADARPGGQVPRRRAEHDAQVVRRRPRAGLLHARRSSSLPPLRPRPVPRPLRPARAAATAASGPVVLIVDDDERLREYVRINLEAEGYVVREAGERRGRARGAGRAVARPDPARRDDAAGRRLGDVAAVQEHTRRRRDPGGHVQRQGRRGSAAEAESRGAQGFIGKPFDPQQLIESDEAAAAGLTQLDQISPALGCRPPDRRARPALRGAFVRRLLRARLARARRSRSRASRGGRPLALDARRRGDHPRGERLRRAEAWVERDRPPLSNPEPEPLVGTCR